jgi:hypothetical protein
MKYFCWDERNDFLDIPAREDNISPSERGIKKKT